MKIRLPQTPNCCMHRPMAEQLAALAHPARIEILRHLAGLEACCCKDVVTHLDLAQSTVSQHLKILVEAGLVRVTPDAQRSRYAVDREAVERLSRSLGNLFDGCAGGDAANT